MTTLAPEVGTDGTLEGEVGESETILIFFSKNVELV